jgi:hypothetical protein
MTIIAAAATTWWQQQFIRALCHDLTLIVFGVSTATSIGLLFYDFVFTPITRRIHRIQRARIFAICTHYNARNTLRIMEMNQHHQQHHQ